MEKKALYNLSYGVFMLSTRSGEKVNGCITNTCMQVANDPVRIAISVLNSNYTCDLIKESGIFTLSLLDQTCSFETIRHFGFQSGREVDKFADYTAYQNAENGVPYITEGTNAYLAVKVTQTVDLGSHTMFIGEVTEMEVLSEEPSANYEYYQEEVKPKPEEVGKTADGQTVWRCTICGYEYVGEELPEDFICPLCKHPASDFEKVIKN